MGCCGSKEGAPPPKGGAGAGGGGIEPAKGRGPATTAAVAVPTAQTNTGAAGSAPRNASGGIAGGGNGGAAEEVDPKATPSEVRVDQEMQGSAVPASDLDDSPSVSPTGVLVLKMPKRRHGRSAREAQSPVRSHSACGSPTRTTAYSCADSTVYSPTVATPTNPSMLVKNRMVLFGHPASPPTVSVLWFLKYNRIDCHFHEIDLRAGEQFSPEFEHKNAAMQVPVLQDGYVSLGQSAAILKYLRKKGKACGGMTFENEEEFNNSQEGLPLTKRYLARVDEYVGRHYTITRMFSTHGLAQIVFAERAHRYQAYYTAMDELLPHLSFFEAMLADGRTFLLGSSLSICDFLFVPEVDFLDRLRMTTAFPKLRAYIKRMREVHGYDKASEQATEIFNELRLEQDIFGSGANGAGTGSRGAGSS